MDDTPALLSADWLAQAEYSYDSAGIAHAQQQALAAAQQAEAAGDATAARFAWALWALLIARTPDGVPALMLADMDQSDQHIAQLGGAEPRVAALLRDARGFVAHRDGRDADAWALALPQYTQHSAERSRFERSFNLRLLARVAMARGDFPEALRFSHLDLLLAREADHPHGIARALHNLGHWHETQFNLDDALPAFQESNALFRTLMPNGRLHAVSTVALLHLLGLVERRDEAYALLQQWLGQPGGPDQDGDRVVDWSAEIAQALLNVGQPAEARRWLAMGSENTYANPRRHTLWTRAMGCWLLGRGEAAGARSLCLDFLDRAARAQRVLEPILRMQLYELIGQACERLGDAAGAAAAARASCGLLVPLVGQSVKAQYVALRVAADPQADRLLGPRDGTRLSMIDRSVADWREHGGAADAAAPAADAAEAKAIADRRWLARLTHDLRSPVHAVQGLTSLLLQTKLDEQQKHLATLTYRSSKQLLHLVADILDMARLDVGRLDIRHELFDLRSMLSECVDIWRVQAGDSVQLSLHVDPAVPEKALSDPRRLLQVLNNLLSNACKAAPRGEVSLGVRCIEQPASAESSPSRWLRFEVSDSGQGISEADQENLFTEFAPLSPEDARDRLAQPGTGMGLSLARSLAARLSGRLGFQSQLGRGSRFWLDMPLNEELLAA